MTTYPNREHENADKAARRRALNALQTITGDAQQLISRLEAGQTPDPNAARAMSADAVSLAMYLTALEVLGDAREWDAADRSIAERQGMNVHLSRWATEAGLDTDLNLPPAERAEDLARRLAAGETRS